MRACAERLGAIEAALLQRGLAMEHSLAVLDGDEGDAVIDLASGDCVDPPDDEALALAIEWSELTGRTNSWA